MLKLSELRSKTLNLLLISFKWTVNLLCIILTEAKIFNSMSNLVGEKKQMEKSQSFEDERWKEDGDRRRQTGTGRVW